MILEQAALPALALLLTRLTLTWVYTRVTEVRTSPSSSRRAKDFDKSIFGHGNIWI